MDKRLRSLINTIPNPTGNPITVRALSYVLAGHVAHHLEGLRKNYL